MVSFVRVVNDVLVSSGVAAAAARWLPLPNQAQMARALARRWPVNAGCWQANYVTMFSAVLSPASVEVPEDEDRNTGAIENMPKKQNNRSTLAHTHTHT